MDTAKAGPEILPQLQKPVLDREIAERKTGGQIMNETFLIHVSGVTIMVWDRRSVIGWIRYIIKNGMAPTIEKENQCTL